MGNEPLWKVERQPAWLVAAIKKTIAGLPDGYNEAAEWLGVTDNALFNRLRTNGDQIFPLGWALVLQRASGNHHIADAVAKASGGVFVPMAELEEVDNADINQRLIEAFEQIACYSRKIKKSIEDGVIDPLEREAITDELYLTITKLQEHSTLVFRIFCAQERVAHRECRPSAPAHNSCGD
ncbi:DNA-binding protein [Edwardsiella ictaluri]|uniref:YmfL family putative regulatory protein n=1 Tax=Edwardsiella ictaluri TaxID=67780 RepID=UPI00031AF7A3|nr:YmfL family putative regulatory protein [Edwardsiella ictaluri]AVZ83504.1 DNA-binding protein [Edwardsiella ictaluri]EKS7764734.1 DNA-binding protein [Edwardsiella ictaluri]EKS7771606.1 DNA-binding protein [Edwardsiella ictaluri]EKS7774755.1 DNA-binding protein [Edwardsiella ictaluri]EKS7778029.1 DNA-binding protein [Edwardsiella ictaluri]